MWLTTASSTGRSRHAQVSSIGRERSPGGSSGVRARGRRGYPPCPPDQVPEGSAEDSAAIASSLPRRDLMTGYRRA